MEKQPKTVPSAIVPSSYAVSSVLTGLEETAAGPAPALHRHHLAAEERDHLGVRRLTERTAPSRSLPLVGRVLDSSLALVRRALDSSLPLVGRVGEGVAMHSACTASQPGPAAYPASPDRCRLARCAAGSDPMAPTAAQPER